MFTERYSVLRLLFGSGLLNFKVQVFVLQELFAVQSSSGDTDSSLELLVTKLQKHNRVIRQMKLI